MRVFAVSVQHHISAGLLAVVLFPTVCHALEPFGGGAQESQTPAKPVDTSSTPPPATSQSGQAGSEQSPKSTTQQKDGSQPVGTAAAPEIKSGGVTASTPSGAVISPGKQKKAHIFTLKTALIVGAVVAVGIVVAATASSPSRP